jgi:putative Mg2+ transporter-C (MgtC) family protein
MVFTLHVGAALLLGTLIGLEREAGRHPAGLRTNALVCVGAALFVCLGQMFDIDHKQPLQIAANIVTGVGFLGAGVIMREGASVRGMNTAATLWCSAALGALCGSGFVVEATVGTGVVLVINACLRPVHSYFERRAEMIEQVATVYRARFTCQRVHEGAVRAAVLRHVAAEKNATLRGMSVCDDGPERLRIEAEIYTPFRNDAFLNHLVSWVGAEAGVTAVHWDRKE